MLQMQPITLGKSRVEALSDGVFAIAMTLLVLDLKVPDRAHHMNDAEMVQQLLAMWRSFLAYGITFLLSGTFWYTHHLVLHFVRGTDKAFLWLNLLFLMMISLLPFSAGLLSHLDVHPVAQLFYFGNQMAIAVLLGAQWEYARIRNMFRVDALKYELQNIAWSVRAMVAFAAAVTVGAFQPARTSLTLALALVSGRLVIRILKRRRQRAAIDQVSRSVTT
jgi:uncharacterized membrane protein